MLRLVISIMMISALLIILSIGPVAMGVGLLQFALYGALIGRTVAEQATLTLLVTTAHLIATLACFSGLLP